LNRNKKFQIEQDEMWDKLSTLPPPNSSFQFIDLDVNAMYPSHFKDESEISLCISIVGVPNEKK